MLRQRSIAAILLCFILGTFCGMLATFALAGFAFVGVVREYSGGALGNQWIVHNFAKYNWSSVQYATKWNGNPIGFVKAYQDAGVLSSTGSLAVLNGQWVKDGAWIYYNGAGLIPQIEYFSDGQVESALQFSDSGLSIFNYKNGILIEKVDYVESKLE